MQLRDCSKSLIHSNRGNVSEKTAKYVGRGEGPCNRESVTYEIKCIGCNNVYVGEKSRSAYTRRKEHSKSLGNKEERSALWKHCTEKHSSEIQQFQMNATGVFFDDAMLKDQQCR